MLWYLQHLAADGTAHPVDLPQSESAFLVHKLKSEASTMSALKAVAFFEAADVNCFPTTETG